MRVYAVMISDGTYSDGMAVVKARSAEEAAQLFKESGNSPGWSVDRVVDVTAARGPGVIEYAAFSE